MTTVIIPPAIQNRLTAQEIQTTRQSGQLFSSSATSQVNPNQFIYFAAFDGTNNDKNKLSTSGTTQQTNVGQLFDQIKNANISDPNVSTGYYPGVGTGGENGGFDARSTNPTPYVRQAAERAYLDFSRDALAWLAADNTRVPRDITTAMTGFSRGAGTAIAFAQILNERGLTKTDGSVVLAPGQVPVVSTILFDPVLTGIEGNLSLPPNVRGNVSVLQALDEFRYLFRAADFSNDPRVNVFQYFGNHGNIGGFYDNGIGALILEASTNFIRNSGIAISDVPLNRQFDSSADVNVYTEGTRSTDGYRIYDEYGTRGNRLTQRIPDRKSTRLNSSHVD